MRRLALTEDEPSELHPLPESISRLSRPELLLLKNTGISALASSISALRSLRILRVNESLLAEEEPETDGPEVALPASLTALSSNLRALSVSMLVHQPLLLQLTFLTRLEVSELPSASAAAPIERGFRHLRDAGALQLVENTEVIQQMAVQFQRCRSGHSSPRGGCVSIGKLPSCFARICRMKLTTQVHLRYRP